MTDFESFQMAIQKDRDLNNEQGSGYMSSLINSMSLMLEEFYSNLDVVGVSSYTGQGFDKFMEAVDNKVDEYNEFYKAEKRKNFETKRKKMKRKDKQNL